MKTARIVLRHEHHEELRRLTYSRPGLEGAAFLLCGQSRGEMAEKLLSHEVLPVNDEEYSKRSRDGLSMSSQALVRVTKRARILGLSVVFVHSHPGGLAGFSEQDDRAEAELIPFLQGRIQGRLHGTIVFSDDKAVARVYSDQRMTATLVVIGDRIQLFTDQALTADDKLFDRQVRAFGTATQRVFAELHVGIVGLGGTGSATAELMTRLGVGSLSLFDGDTLDATNLNRVWGSTKRDVGVSKVELAKRHLEGIDLATKIHSFPEHITSESTANALRDCDVIFGCTDKQLPRAILLQLALKYNIPVIDMGVLIDSERGHLKGVLGRITTLLPGEACLFCRGRISPDAMRVEALAPADRARQARDGYAPELEEPAPAVVTFTASVAAWAVTELVHRITGFMGADRHSSEVLIEFDRTRVHTNRVSSRPTCCCADPASWGTGDQAPFLGMTWPTHTR